MLRPGVTQERVDEGELPRERTKNRRWQRPYNLLAEATRGEVIAHAAGRGGPPTGRGVVPPIRRWGPLNRFVAYAVSSCGCSKESSLGRGGIIWCQCEAITRIADVYKKNPAPDTAAPSAIQSRWISIYPSAHPTDVLPFLSPPIRPPSPRLLPRLAMKRGKSKADTTKKADTRLSVKKGGERATKKPRKTKAAKDPNKPKRPPSAFFVFMCASEKAPYVAKAAKLKTDYTKKIAAYNKNQEEEDDE
ncbi:hypothetical protein BHM03_00020130 [Ensete ventricosum]|nr:hypothetical protein BHM03_00020130 [Ensete ventricosum]